MRDYVAARVGPEILNEGYCVVSDPDDIPFSSLPDAFVVKATHGSGMNIFVTNKAKLDIEAAKERCRGFLKRTYGEETNERHYLAIPPHILVEEFLFEPHGVPAVDYKCYVLHGRCHYIWVHCGRFAEHTARFFDRDWRPLDVVLHFPLGPVVERPRNLERIIEIAEKRAEGFDFLRVDPIRSRTSQ